MKVDMMEDEWYPMATILMLDDKTPNEGPFEVSEELYARYVAVNAEMGKVNRELLDIMDAHWKKEEEKENA